MLRSFACLAVVVLALIGSARAQNMDNYLGKNASAPVATLGARAKLYDRHLNAITTPGPQDIVVWQNPLPGEPFVAPAEAMFLVTDKVPVPELVGMRVGDAETLLSYLGLTLAVTSNCRTTGVAPAEDQQDSQITEQCVAPGTLYDPGNFVGVIIGPWPESLSGLTIGLAALAALAALTAIVFFTRGRFLQQELDVFKSGGQQPPS
jgi:beta-lactam-binding protein with PASTA domain